MKCPGCGHRCRVDVCYSTGGYQDETHVCDFCHKQWDCAGHQKQIKIVKKEAGE